MARSATTGIYTRVDNSFSNPVVGTTISPTDADTYFDDIDSGMNAFIGTSTTSLAIGTGAKTFTTQLTKSFPVGMFVQAFSQADHANYMYGSVTSYSAVTGALVLDVTVVGGSGTLNDWLLITAGARGGTGLTGDTGLTGATGATVGVQFAYSTTTADADPGAGVFRLNNATVASATAGYFDNADAGGATVSAWLDTFDDTTNTAKGTLVTRGVTSPTAWAVFNVTGSVVDGTGYRKLTLTYVAGGGTFTDGETFAFMFSRSGDKGADGAGSGDMLAANNLSDLASAVTSFANIKQAASTTATGVAELSTDAEAIDKADTARVLTPSNLAALGSSATFAGLVELATDAETITGTDTDRAITPANLTARVASTTATGIVELATSAETQARTDTDRAVTPAGFASATRELLSAARTYYVRTQPVAVTSITNASPTVVNATSHGLSINDPVVFSTTGALPTGLTAGTIYYLITAGFGVNAFQVSTSLGGAAVNTSSAGSGTHSFQTGNDTNNGLAQTRTGALLTPQAAITLAQALDTNRKTVTVQFADGVYTSNCSVAGILMGQVSATSLVLQGNSSTPTNVDFNISGNNCFTITDGGKAYIKDLRIRGAALGIFASDIGTKVFFSGVDCGATTAATLYCSRLAYMEIIGACTVSGGGADFIQTSHQGNFRAANRQFTLTANVTFSGTVAYASSLADITFTGYSGSCFTLGAFAVTGKRYTVEENAIIQQLIGASFFPGTIAGTTATGGQYN